MFATENPQKTTINESVLIDRAKTGDRAAYRKLYDVHVAMVYGLALRMVNEVNAAEDVTQEAFVRAWQSLESFKGESRFATWLHRITSNTAVDYLRKHRSWLQLIFNSDEDVKAVEDSEQLFYSGDLEKLIARLPERARIVFVLHTIEGYRHEQIAELTKMAVGSSKAQLNRAKSLLRGWMHND